METTITRLNSVLKVRDIRNCSPIAAATDAGMTSTYIGRTVNNVNNVLSIMLVKLMHLPPLPQGTEQLINDAGGENN